MPSTIAHISVVLNLDRPKDREIYDKLQGCPKGGRAEIIKEALLQYLDGDGREKTKEIKVLQEVKRTHRKEIPATLEHYGEKQAPTSDEDKNGTVSSPVVTMEAVKNPVPVKDTLSKAEKDTKGGNDTKDIEDTRNKLRSLVY